MVKTMPKFVVVMLAVMFGFVAAAAVGYFLIGLLSSNRHDRSVEAAMTAIFVLGPLGAVIAGTVAYFKIRA